MSLFIVKGDLFKQKVDAIVIPGKADLKLDGSLGEQARAALGELFEKELNQLKRIKFLDCAIVNSYCKNIKKVIYTANPKWNSKSDQNRNRLNICIINCLELAETFKCKSIALPVLSIGAYGFNKRVAVDESIETIKMFLEDQDENSSLKDVYLVFYDADVFNKNKDLFEGLTIIDGPLNYKKYDPEKRKKEIARNIGFGEGLEEALESTNINKIGDKLKIYQKMQSMSAEQACNGVVDGSTYRRYLTNKLTPSRNVLIMLGIAMNLDEEGISDLLSSIGAALNTSYDRKIMCAYQSFRDENKVIEPGEIRIDSFNEFLIKHKIRILTKK